ncbi:hypothetical protein [Winogradskyella sp. PG-2]|uniref:hypothetical protein n=1 Tax=Winogradskyella sp. PG-2 TaxID=754409 RepID=UPI0004586B32|nr:hypothetical protein [Winogradskyella sp. PG-2]BAO77627.1 hypothetical protein WPG_3397 [Winogradskyella sp. PG-2]
MSTRLVYFIFGVLSFCIRFFFESQSNIITGINGGYISVQIMKIYEHGHLAVNDMPLVFYINALLVKTGVFLFPNHSIEFIVLIVVKITGAISIPLILFPLYKMNHKLIDFKLPKIYEYSILIFCLFSFSSLYLGAEMMKNAYGLVGFMFFIYFFFQFVKQNSKKYTLMMGLTLVLIAVTHFGVFSISIIFLIISLICIYKKHAFLPVVSVVAIGFLMVCIFDSFRAYNAINIFEKWFGLPWRIVYYPAGIVNSIVNLLIVILLFFSLKNNTIKKPQRQILIILLVFTVLLALPILRFELWRRFSFMLFVPQAVVLVLVFPYLKDIIKRKIPLVIISISFIALLYNIVRPKNSVINEAAYNDLANISSKIENSDKTLIIVRHGLDWWMIWQLHVKMSQPQILIDKATMDKYDNILILRQKKGKIRLYPGPYSPFVEPKVPAESLLLYSSNYFDLYKWSNLQ